ncbi:division/cell wall cluster transcriptional repressor MraZ [Magnetospirillum sp. UT-4]|uniref:division/cell wall cluster transcriptional repressor MraZ n=1 Tax=Magnetospirillum sp. UT-4 TaxID=2681467 RepID=UPI00137D1CC8|nr:division/cell wall cluster transcriptional repressor MraZ [Magnetospirillum sp. UT-4]CAA7618536.1 Protein MraZ [Magnetospirillum sp. UT-4]
MGLFLSTFVNKVDRKGRVSVPASFRATLAGQPFAGIVAYRSFTNACIEGCGMDYMQRLSDSTQDFAAFSAEQEDLSALIFADARQLAWDPEGRILLPEDVMAHAGIGEAAAFVGKGQTFQIWEPEAYRAVEAEVRARALKARPTLPLKPKGGEAQ